MRLKCSLTTARVFPPCAPDSRTKVLFILKSWSPPVVDRTPVIYYCCQLHSRLCPHNWICAPVTPSDCSTCASHTLTDKRSCTLRVKRVFFLFFYGGTDTLCLTHSLLLLCLRTAIRTSVRLLIHLLRKRRRQLSFDCWLRCCVISCLLGIPGRSRGWAAIMRGDVFQRIFLSWELKSSERPRHYSEKCVKKANMYILF